MFIPCSGGGIRHSNLTDSTGWDWILIKLLGIFSDRLAAMHIARIIVRTWGGPGGKKGAQTFSYPGLGTWEIVLHESGNTGVERFDGIVDHG